MPNAMRVFAALALLAVTVHAQQTVTPDKKASPYGVFVFTEQLMLPAPPEQVYDAMTGDISEWWDHSFSPKPYKLYIEPKPGGGFYEIFNANGDGVLHATVTYAERGKKLRYVGPLGLAGKAIDLVTTHEFSPVGKDSTRLTLSVHAAGEVDAGLEQIVHGAWKHFLFERFKPYVETGAYRKPRR